MNGWLKAISEPMNAADFRLDISYPELGDFLPIVVICGISILLTALWVLAMSGCARPKDKDLTRRLE